MASSIVASVAFLRIQDFSRRPASEQARLRAQLEAVVAVTTAELDPASRIVLEASDGVAIVLLRDPAGAVRLAQRALTASAAGLPLSAGLNHGALQAAGRKGAEGMTGDGIAVAAAIAEFAPASRLLASRSFRDALADAEPGREASLVAAGAFKTLGCAATKSSAWTRTRWRDASCATRWRLPCWSLRASAAASPLGFPPRATSPLPPQ